MLGPNCSSKAKLQSLQYKRISFQQSNVEVCYQASIEINAFAAKSFARMNAEEKFFGLADDAP